MVLRDLAPPRKVHALTHLDALHFANFHTRARRPLQRQGLANGTSALASRSP